MRLSSNTADVINCPTMIAHRIDARPQETSMKSSAAPGERLADLMRRSQEGDNASYAELLHEISVIARRFAGSRGYSLQSSDIEDVVQDVLIAIHSVRETYDPKRPFLPWLVAIIHNRYVDAIRRLTRRSKNEMLVEEYPVTFDQSESNLDAQGYGDISALHQAIESLPDAQRRAIKLVKIGDMSLKEASAASGMTVPALKVAIHRAVKTLRRRLKR